MYKNYNKLRDIYKEFYFTSTHMLKECNFKSKIRHRDQPGCRLTPADITCPGEENCILYITYKHLENKNKKK